MVDMLPELIPTFPGQANLTGCFNHILSLVAKTAVHQFDVSKSKANDALDEAEWELRELAEGVDLEDLATQIDDLQKQMAVGGIAENDDDNEDNKL
ncbi:hypothetical protein Hypma_005265 [Hypsizygus marmoreus]|uniref:Uncharacterized protein n=1 Tax=Hypsizygus marmoreus TaxID=39966 RepID=A0A369K4C3_HYPMA|nr:hypothetical protein Hypma_005265 [Hypsizygus marmoreus]